MNGTILLLPGPGMDSASLQELMAGEEVIMISGVPTVWLGLFEFLKQNDIPLKTVKRTVMGRLLFP